jgi:predicted dehydrogenase
MVNVGVVGCGRIAERHIDGYKRLDGVSVTVADIQPGLAESFAAQHRVDWRRSPDELFEDRSIDAIDVCVPTPFHAGLVIRALGADKHVFCEKPLCETLAEGREIEAAQRRTNRVVMVGYLYRFHPAYQLAKDVLDEGVIGRPHLGVFRLGGRGNTRPWKHQAENGGGAILEMMVHSIDLVQWLIGPITEIRPLASKRLLETRHISGEEVAVTAEDYVLCELRAGGAEVICQADLATPSYMNYTDIQADNGSLFASILHFLPTIVYCREPRGVYNLGNNFFQFQQVNLFELELAHFIDSLKDPSASRNSVKESLAVLQMIEEIRGMEISR